VERNVGDAERHRRAVNAGHIGSLVVSADNTMAITCVSQRKPSGNSGRMGRSIWRLVRISRSLGRPSRLMNPRDPSRSIGIFAIVNGQREKIDALARIGIGASRGQHNIVANAHNAGAVRLLG